MDEKRATSSPNEGEGSTSADRAYREGVQSFLAHTDPTKLARQAERELEQPGSNEMTDKAKTENEKKPHADTESYFAQVKTLRDEIRVRLHLFGMDARDRFNKLETEAENLALNAGKATHDAIDDLTKRFKELRDDHKDLVSKPGEPGKKPTA